MGDIDMQLIDTSDTYLRHKDMLSLFQIMACRLFATKPFYKPMRGNCWLKLWEQRSVGLEMNTFCHTYDVLF